MSPGPRRATARCSRSERRLPPLAAGEGRRWLRLALACALSCLLAACQRAEAPPARPVVAEPAPPTPASPAPLLWRIEHAGAVSHLLGSVHVARPDAYPLDARIEQGFEASEALVLEVNLDADAERRLALDVLARGRLPAGQTLLDHVAPETYQSFERTVTDPALRGALAELQPWLVALTLTTRELERLGFSAERGFDTHFRRRALALERPIYALETAEEQIEVFAALARERQDELLRTTLEELPRYEAIMNEAFAAWQRGEPAELERLLLGPLRERDPQLYEEMFVARNRKMAERLAAMLGDGRSRFVVVGAGHLVGPDNVVELLAERGIAVARP